MAQRCEFSLPAVFIASWQRSLSVPKPAKQNAVKCGDHGSIRDSWPIAFSGYPRGPRVACETRCPKHAGPNESAETRSRTRVSREPDGHRQRNTQGWSGSAQGHSSCLWFQIFGVEAHCSLPYDQHNRGHLSGQGQACHLRSHPFGHQGCVEFLERTRFDRSDGRCTLKQVLQIVIAVSVQSANRYLLPGSLQLSLDLTVIGTAVHFDAEAAEFPERSLAAEAVRCLDQRDQQRRPDRTDRRDLAKQLRRRMLLTFGEQLAPYFLAQRPQGIELLIVKLGPAKPSPLGNLGKPLGTMTGRIDLLAGTGNTPAAIDGLHPAHDACEIFADGQIAACQFPRCADAGSTVIDRAKLVHVQPVGQLAGIDPVILVPLSGILPRIAHHEFCYMRLQQVVQPGGPSSFFKGDLQLSAKPMDKV